MTSTRILLERITARVFCHGSGGGNPVTVFSSPVPLSASMRERLAKSCEWESVMVSLPAEDEEKEVGNSSSSSPPSKVSTLAFYMPSGSAVSFCAHAALGAAFATLTTRKEWGSEFVFQSLLTTDNPNQQSQQQQQPYQTIHISAMENESMGTARLQMKTSFEETPVSHPPALYRLLRGHLGVGSEHLVNKGKQYPTMINSSIARPKTLVYVNSTRALHDARQPKVVAATTADDDDESLYRNSFATACGSIDDSTGIYLYTTKKEEENAWECRQFPRASGYPEDPATGIAAAALAGSLYKNGIYLPVYKFYQGTAMQRPSLIEVLDFRMPRTNDVSFTLQGRIEIDSRDTIDMEEEVEEAEEA